jgi:hypothetical protein
VQRREQHAECDDHGCDEAIDHRVDLVFELHLHRSKISPHRGDIGLRCDVVVDGVVNLGGDALGRLALHAGALKRARQGQPVGHDALIRAR